MQTFHAFALRLLREEVRRVPGLRPGFGVCAAAERRALVRRLLEARDLDPRELRPADVVDRLSARKRATALGQAPAACDLPEGLAEAYDAELLRTNRVDFDDLLARSEALLRGDAAARVRWRRRVRHVLVDEYQDTSGLQVRLLLALVGADGNVMAVGDPDQSIYGWRGAQPESLLGFEDDFPGARAYALSTNYRSTGSIVAAARQLIEHQTEREPLPLRSSREEGEAPWVLECDTDRDEAHQVTDLLRTFRREGRAHGDVAVLYRQTAQQRVLEAALRRAKVPYQVRSGPEFYERREVAGVLAYLRLMANPRDDDAFELAARVPPRGIGPASLGRLRTVVQEASAHLPAWQALSLVEGGRSDRAIRALPGRARAGLVELRALLDELLEPGERAAAEAVEAVLEALDVDAWLDSLAGGEEGAERRANLEELLHHAREYDERRPDDGLEGFLAETALTEDGERPAGEDAGVQLLTLHASKGLEFPIVILVGVEEELLPHARSVQPGDPAGVEEERRLLYVGITRAQDQLVLTHAARRRLYGERRLSRPSRFLGELPLERLLQADSGELRLLRASHGPAAGGFALGEWVRHPHYGVGEVVGFLGQGHAASLLVHFSEHGTRELMLAHTSLTRVVR